VLDIAVRGQDQFISSLLKTFGKTFALFWSVNFIDFYLGFLTVKRII
jgi:hypothetical protein